LFDPSPLQSAKLFSSIRPAAADVRRVPRVGSGALRRFFFLVPVNTPPVTIPNDSTQAARLLKAFADAPLLRRRVQRWRTGGVVRRREAALDRHPLDQVLTHR